MGLDQPTLIQFEAARKQQGFIPPQGSNSFYNIGPGKINLSTLRSDPLDYRFDLFTHQGRVYTGAGNFTVSGDIIDQENPYRNMTVINDTTLSINHILTISKGTLEVYGTLELMSPATLLIKNKANVVLSTDSVLVINDNTTISVETGSNLTIYGRIDVHVSRVDSIINAPGVTIDSAAVMNVSGINFKNRPYSLTDYDAELRKDYINIYTQGEKNFTDGRIGYLWRAGNPSEPSQVIGMLVLWGEAVLGDFRLPILGLPNNTYPRSQMLSDIHIKKGTTLHITESYNGSEFIRPELYLGIVIGNSKKTADCLVEGTIIADGINSMITVDRGATVHIQEGGEIHLKNGAIMRSTHNDDRPLLYINGTLIVDDISQIVTFNRTNIVFGEKGKVVVVNPDSGEKRLLFTTPNGIENSDLYRLFKDSIDHIEYHISNNTGIGIDQFFEFYSRDMINWFGGRRIEKAIYDGIIVWHDGGFIELYHHITPWINTDSTLLEAARIFKTYGSYDQDKLQDAVNRLMYAGCGDIIFRFIDGDVVTEVAMILKGVNMKSVLNHPLSHKYILKTDNDGQLFLRNKLPNSSISSLIHPDSRMHDIIDNEVEFPLP